MQHVVNVTSPEKAYNKTVETQQQEQQQQPPTTESQQQSHTQNNQAAYEDDFLDMHCDDMDMF